MSLEGFVKKHPIAVVGGIGLAAIAFFMMHRQKGVKIDFEPKGKGFEINASGDLQGLLGGHHPVARANLASKIGYMNRANPGVDDLDNWVNQTAAGHNAGLDPSEYSYLTQQNRNPLLSTLKNIPLMGQGHRDFERIKFQGSWGFTGPAGQGFNTYF